MISDATTLPRFMLLRMMSGVASIPENASRKVQVVELELLFKELNDVWSPKPLIVPCRGVKKPLLDTCYLSDIEGKNF